MTFGLFSRKRKNGNAFGSASSGSGPFSMPTRDTSTQPGNAFSSKSKAHLQPASSLNSSWGSTPAGAQRSTKHRSTKHRSTPASAQPSTTVQMGGHPSTTLHVAAHPTTSSTLSQSQAHQNISEIMRAALVAATQQNSSSPVKYQIYHYTDEHLNSPGNSAHPRHQSSPQRRSKNTRRSKTSARKKGMSAALKFLIAAVVIVYALSSLAKLSKSDWPADPSSTHASQFQPVEGYTLHTELPDVEPLSENAFHENPINWLDSRYKSGNFIEWAPPGYVEIFSADHNFALVQSDGTDSTYGETGSYAIVDLRTQKVSKVFSERFLDCAAEAQFNNQIACTYKADDYSSSYIAVLDLSTQELRTIYEAESPNYRDGTPGDKLADYDPIALDAQRIYLNGHTASAASNTSTSDRHERNTLVALNIADGSQAWEARINTHDYRPSCYALKEHLGCEIYNAEGYDVSAYRLTDGKITLNQSTESYVIGWLWDGVIIEEEDATHRIYGLDGTNYGKVSDFYSLMLNNGLIYTASAASENPQMLNDVFFTSSGTPSAYSNYEGMYLYTPNVSLDDVRLLGTNAEGSLYLAELYEYGQDNRFYLFLDSSGEEMFRISTDELLELEQGLLKRFNADANYTYYLPSES